MRKINKNSGKNILLVPVFIMFILASCNAIYHINTADENSNYVKDEVGKNIESHTNFVKDYQPEVGDVSVYYLSKKSFADFLRNPTLENVSAYCGSLSVYSKHISKSGYIQAKFFSKEHSASSDSISGFYRAGSWPIYTEFIEFMNDPNNFKKALINNKVEDELLSYVIITHSQYETKDNKPLPPGTYPVMCIWVHTEKGDYFLEFDGNLYDDSQDKTFRYNFYTLEEYMQMYSAY